MERRQQKRSSAGYGGAGPGSSLPGPGGLRVTDLPTPLTPGWGKWFPGPPALALEIYGKTREKFQALGLGGTVLLGWSSHSTVQALTSLIRRTTSGVDNRDLNPSTKDSDCRRYDFAME